MAKDNTPAFPAVVSRDGPWNVISPSPFIPMPTGPVEVHGKKYFIVPDGIDKGEVAVRVREYAKMAAFAVGNLQSDLNATHDVDYDWLGAVVDAYVNGVAQLAGDDIKELPFAVEPNPGEKATTSQWAQVVMRSSGLYAGDQIISNAIKSGALNNDQGAMLEKVAYGLVNMGYRNYALDTKRAVAIAQMLESLFGGKRRPSPTWGDGGPMDNQLMQEILHSSFPLPGQLEAIWGAMKWITFDMNISAPAPRIKKPKWRPGYAGPFRYPSRALLPSGDGTAFAVKRKVLGGTVLVDVSGSMSLDADDLDAIVASVPAITVIVYSGDGAAGKIGYIVRDGRMADFHEVEDCMPGENVIDGPALRWLATQPEPRIWVSDGHVTGVGDSRNIGLVLDARNIVRENRIIQIGNMSDVMHYLDNPISCSGIHIEE